MQAHAKDFVPRIQGLRALAVLSVLVFHIWPEALPGGYVGVDVFFVISGYLITGALHRELTRTGSISLVDFYVRRIRRLLPAASAALFAVTLGIPMLPAIQWRSTAYEVLASAVYAENWWLTKKAFDYLASDEPPSPVVHFWSLSIEEQWYILLPASLVATAWLARRSRVDTGRAVGWLLGLAAAGSLAASLTLTPLKPTWAYFATTTRLWELALGGLLALHEPGIRRALRGAIPALGVLGLLAVVCCMFAFGATTAFPGAWALVPTLGAAAIVLSARADSSGSRSLLGWLDTSPALFVGDISYSLYLWHWPAIVFARQVFWDELHAFSFPEGVLVAAASLLLSVLSKRYVEDPFRHRSSGSRRLPFVFAAGSMAALALVAWGFRRWEANTIVAGRAPTAALAARALAATEDVPDVYARCRLGADDSTLLPCAYGNPDADTHIVLAGDSHAAHWIPAVAELAERSGIRVTTYTKNACPIADVTVMRLRAPYAACRAWRRALLDRLISDPPNVVLLGQSRSYAPIEQRADETATQALQRGLTATYRQLVEANVKVFFLADTPRTVRNTNQCLSMLGATLDECSMEEVTTLDPIVLAKKELGGFVIQLTDDLCVQGRCRASEGPVLIWRDTNHLTASYSRTFGGRIGQILTSHLADASAAPVSPLSPN